MAKKSNKGSSKATKANEYEAPEGFDINAGRERGDGWVAKEEGNVVMGKLLGRMTYQTKRGKTRGFYQVELIRPCRIVVDNPDFNEEADEDDTNTPQVIEERGEGTIVNLDEFKKLEDMAPYTKDGNVYNVWMVMGPKVEIGDDQTMWTLLAGPKLAIVKRANSEKPF